MTCDEIERTNALFKCITGIGADQFVYNHYFGHSEDHGSIQLNWPSIEEARGALLFGTTPVKLDNIFMSNISIIHQELRKKAANDKRNSMAATTKTTNTNTQVQMPPAASSSSTSHQHGSANQSTPTAVRGSHTTGNINTNASNNKSSSSASVNRAKKATTSAGMSSHSNPLTTAPGIPAGHYVQTQASTPAPLHSISLPAAAATSYSYPAAAAGTSMVAWVHGPDGTLLQVPSTLAHHHPPSTGPPLGQYPPTYAHAPSNNVNLATRAPSLFTMGQPPQQHHQQLQHMHTQHVHMQAPSPQPLPSPGMSSVVSLQTHDHEHSPSPSETDPPHGHA